MTIHHRLSPQVRPHRPLRTVLIGTSLGDESDRVAGAGLAVARAAGARVHLVHAAHLEPLPVGLEVGAGPVADPERLARSAEALRRQAARLDQAERTGADELRRFVLENRPAAPFQAETAVLPGEARREILRQLAEDPVDLLILGTHGRGGWDRLTLGSVASTVVRKAPCSVLVISPEAALSEGIAEAVESQTAPAWHREPAGVA